MNLKLKKAVLPGIFVAFSVFAQDSNTSPKLPERPDKEKLSYALGMNLGLQIKQAGMDANIDVVVEAIRDVLAGKPAEIQESEIASIFRQAQAAGRLKQASTNIAEGAAFLAKNAKEPGVTVLPDGLQYRVIRTGTGDFPKRLELLTLKFRGTWINSKEFKHNDRLEIPFLGCTKGLQEALQMMKVGSEWQIFVPYNLAYGRVGERADGFGSTLIYDLELISAEPENARPNQHHSSGRVGHSLDEDVLPEKL
jgi:FKBP-type peptidyl-prolyl cis-trans isomerase FklB